MRWLAVLLAAVFCFYLCTIRAGHGWGDDYALYIHEARNIATGTPYASTGLIADSYSPGYSPHMTAPVFPLALAAVYKMFGLNLEAFKTEEVIFFVAALAAICLFFQNLLPPAYVLLLGAILGFSPFFWDSKDNILSDLPFLCFLWLAIVLMEKRKSALLCGLVVYLAIGTRGAGLILLPAILFWEFWRMRRITRYAVTIVVTAIACVALQRLVLGGDPVLAYGGQFHPALAAMAFNLRYYRDALALFWGSRTFWPPLLISAALLPIAFLKRREPQPVLPLVFACIYAPLLIVWPYHDPRYLIPLFPIFLFYALRGLSRLGTVATVAVCWLVLLGYLSYYHGANFSTIPESTGRPTFVAMCSYLRSNTLPDTRIVFHRARSLALFADRSASTYHEPIPGEDLWKHFREQGIRYIVVSTLFDRDQNVLVPLVEAHKPDLKLTYENPEFKVYRLTPPDIKTAR